MRPSRLRRSIVEVIMEIIQLSDYRKPPPPPAPRKKSKSQYDLYPMPFFNKKRRCTWDVQPTGDYEADCRTGRSFAIEFLKSNDKTCGWAGLQRQIVGDMIAAGPSGSFPDGYRKINGIVIGFMSVIGIAAAHSTVLDSIYNYGPD
jgi:hypothetical protein